MTRGESNGGRDHRATTPSSTPPSTPPSPETRELPSSSPTLPHFHVKTGNTCINPSPSLTISSSTTATPPPSASVPKVASDNVNSMTSSSDFITPESIANNDVQKVIKDIIAGYYPGAWPCLKKVPQETKDLWFQKFSTYYTWNPMDAFQIRKNFYFRAGKWLREVMGRCRRLKKKTDWMSKEVWEGLQCEWADEKFQAISQVNKTNRLTNVISASTVYQDGSASLSNHKRKLAESLDHPSSLIEESEKCCKTEEDNWTCSKADDAVEKFRKLSDDRNITSQGLPESSLSTSVNDQQLWLQNQINEILRENRIMRRDMKRINKQMQQLVSLMSDKFGIALKEIMSASEHSSSDNNSPS
ncbi:uncharacterized protein LOC105161888 [Sesamum indicum]|uniref:Uncharacterized protein LOC105161888 n=1 Tax=Sesamum indicum TaxID=4182 RepID=A0A6I9TBK5_SESIN|nr:uncharacterized protein LOC105161888 [Sesamum indicum]